MIGLRAGFGEGRWRMGDGGWGDEGILSFGRGQDMMTEGEWGGMDVNGLAGKIIWWKFVHVVLQ